MLVISGIVHRLQQQHNDVALSWHETLSVGGRIKHNRVSTCLIEHSHVVRTSSVVNQLPDRILELTSGVRTAR